VTSEALARAAGQALLESSAEAVVIVDREGRVVFANGRAEAMFGYAPGELVGQPVEILLPERFRPAHRQHRTRYFDAPRPRPMGLGLDLAGRRKDGTEFPVEISLSSFVTADGPFAVGLISDITQRKQSEEAFLRLAAIVESSDDAIISMGLDGTIVSWNAGAERIYGYTAEEIAGRSPALLVPPDRSHEVEQILQALREGKSIEHFETVRVRKGGRRVHVSLSGSPLRDAAGRIVGTSIIVRDITGRRQLERAARQAEKLAALGTLSAGIAHEFNNPISIITSRIELMLMDADTHSLPQEVRDDLQVLHQHAQRVSQIARGLLSFARQSGGELRPLDLSQLVEQTLLFMQTQIVKEGIEIRTALDRGLPPLMGDANALQQVVVNLLTNARDAIDGRGEIRLETGPAPDDPSRIRLVVSDTGSGIPPEELPRIFDPFYTTKPRGTGLGLSVSYGIVQDHQGTIEVESERGRGTTFVISFPVSR
jgi:PAS domain S-box-containing protein